MYFSALAFSDMEDHLRQIVAARSAGRGDARGLRILLPFDGSQASEHAARYVARSLAGTQASVVLLNAQQPILDDPALLHSAGAIVAAHRAAGDRVLGVARGILEAEGVACASEVAFGPAVEAIVKAADARRCALVVMGTRGRHALVNLFTGSVPSRVVQRSPVPVMLIRHQMQGLLRMPRQPSAPFIAA